MYKAHAHIILRLDERGPIKNNFNFPIDPHFENSDLGKMLEQLFERHLQWETLINISYGRILRNIETGVYRYFGPDEGFFGQKPVKISNREDLNRFIEKLNLMNVKNMMFTKRPNTKWVVVFPC